MNKHRNAHRGGVATLEGISKVTLFSILPLAALSAVFFTTSVSTPNASAETATAHLNVGVTVLPTCNVSADITEHAAEFTPGTYKDIGGETTFTVSCNSSDGWSIYAVGASGDNGAEGNTNLVGSSSNIATGTATEGATSNWSFKLSNPSEGLTIASGYDANSAIPATRTKVISRESGTTAANTGDTFKTSYSAYVASMQAPDVYKGSVKYILFHPATVATRTMQDFSCASLQKGQLTTLIDSRDNNPYEVAKLQDDKCWMVDNMRYATGAAFVGSDGGGYYTFDNAKTVCPTGWRLPTGGSGGEFETLVKAYGFIDDQTEQATSEALRSSPIPGFTLSGYYGGNTLKDKDTRSFFWSSTEYSSTDGYRLGLLTSQVNPTHYGTKTLGQSVRCVAN